MVAGVDGCRGGWLVALLAVDEASFHLCHNFVEVIDLCRPCQLLAVDMPIGLPTCQTLVRRCDQEVRRRLGPRRASLFAAPPRWALGAGSYEEVRGAGLSLQSYYLLPKIAEIEAWITPQRQERVYEAHPEVVFQRLLGRPLAWNKKCPEGQQLRRDLLGRIPDSNFPRKWVQPDDLLDALALAHSALDRSRGKAWRFPSQPQDREWDQRQLAMEIWG